MEFLILLAFMLLIFSSFIIMAQNFLVGAQSSHVITGLIDLSNTLESEILMMNQLSEGYSRNFTLPPYVIDEAYTVRIEDGVELILNTTYDEYIVFLPFQVNTSDITGVFSENIMFHRNSSGLFVLNRA